MASQSAVAHPCAQHTDRQTDRHTDHAKCDIPSIYTLHEGDAA